MQLTRLPVVFGLIVTIGFSVLALSPDIALSGERLSGQQFAANGAAGQEAKGNSEPSSPDEDKPAEGTAPASEGDPRTDGQPQDGLASGQDSVSRRFKRFEDTLLKLAEVMRKTDPDRAALLIRALGKSKEDRIAIQLNDLVELLKKDQLGDAIDRQAEIMGQLHGLLDLLLSENRAKEVAAEKARITKYLKDLNKIIGQEKDLRAATERGEAAEELANRQKKVAERAEELGKSIDQDDAAKRAENNESLTPPQTPSDAEPADPKAGDQPKDKSGEPKKADDKDGNPGEGKPKDQKDGKKGDEKKEGSAPEKKSSDEKSKDGKPGESKPGESKPGESKPGESKPGESQPGAPKPGEKQESTPGRENLEKARREMEQAIDKLKKKSHQDASDRQDEALRELVKAKEKLEEILRQLREEEKERMLAALEARFQKMLALELAIHDGTTKLDKTPAADRGSRHFTQSVQLARQQDVVALEASKAITLLREEGSAVAFPEAVEQMRDDMRIVTGRLERSDVAELTQSIQKEIIDALQEMIESLQKEMEKGDKDKKPQPSKPQDSQPQDQSLVDQLSELKMLRSLQLRINHRTRRLGRMVEGEQAVQPDIVNQLQNLADRQARIQQATFDLATGRNK